MKNKLLTLAILSFTGYLINAQVGINTGLPQATLDVVGFPTNINKPDGIIAPRLSLSQLAAKTYAAAQTGALVYVTSINATPAGSTINVTTPGYYYYDGTVWIFTTPSDWHTTGNSGTTAAAGVVGSTISSGNFLGTKDSQNLVIATAGAIKGILYTDGTLRGGNTTAAGPYASLVWGSNNTISDTTLSSSVVLGKDNTVSAQGPNFPGVAIGSGNTTTNGAKAIGNNNNLNGSNQFAMGNLNAAVAGSTSGIALGNNNTFAGFVLGSSNNVTSSNYAFGNSNTVTASGGAAMAIGIGAQATTANQTIYANTQHAFFGQSTATNTVVGINMAPTAASSTGAAIQMKGIAAAAGTSCTSAEEGAIRYNITIHAHEGCNGTIWKAF